LFTVLKYGKLSENEGKLKDEISNYDRTVRQFKKIKMAKPDTPIGSHYRCGNCQFNLFVFKIIDAAHKKEY
tara:strand:+ start:4148 stop:4360 length:213 start_codon:yes stop_codon:yes gene_type:complete